MTDLIIIIAVPVITALLGLLPQKRGKSVPHALLFGVLVFAAAAFGSGKGYKDLSELYKNRRDAPSGTSFAIRLASYFSEDPRLLIMIISALGAVCAALFIYRFCTEQKAGALMFAVCGFIFAQCQNVSIYIAAVLCLISVRYIYEIRFFRFAAIILLAACFDITALLMLPLFFAAQVKNPRIMWVICGVAEIALTILGLGDALIGLISDKPLTEYAVPLGAVIVTALLAVTATLIYKLFGTNDYAVMSTNILIFGCLAAVVSLADGRFAPLALFAAMPSATVVGSEIYSVGLKLTKGTFKNSASAVRICSALSLVIAAAIFAVMLFSGSFGISAYRLMFFAEVV